MFNIGSLTLGEVAKVEELARTGIGTLGEDEAPKGLLMAALAFVVKRREDPKFTWNEALGMTLPEAHAVLGIGDEEPETAEAVEEAAEESDPSPAPTKSRRKSQTTA
jgi:hypothetical protein